MRYLSIAAITLLALSGCAVNGFEKYYSSAPGADAVLKRPGVEHPVGPAKVYTYSSSDLRAEHLRMQEEGYIAVGSASFYGGPRTMTRSELFARARKVGASVVLIHSQYKDTLSGSVPLVLPNAPVVSTVNTSGTVNEYGSGGYATGHIRGSGNRYDSGRQHHLQHSLSRR